MSSEAAGEAACKRCDLLRLVDVERLDRQPTFGGIRQVVQLGPACPSPAPCR